MNHRNMPLALSLQDNSTQNPKKGTGGKKPAGSLVLLKLAKVSMLETTVCDLVCSLPYLGWEIPLRLISAHTGLTHNLKQLMPNLQAI